MIQVQGFYPSLFPAKDTLENTSWANIAIVAAAGLAPTYWAVGDTKTITFGSAVLGSTSIVVKIMGFGYDDLASGGKAPITFGMVDCFATTRAHNWGDTNDGGWPISIIRNDCINTIFPALQSLIGVDIIKPVYKRTSRGNESGSINTTTDSVWLFSEYEVFGSATYSVAGEKPTDQSARYPAFVSGTIKKTGGASGANWWTRSPNRTNSTQWCFVGYSGLSAGSGWSGNGMGVSIGFCV